MISFMVLFTNGKHIIVQAYDKREAVKAALDAMLPCYTQRHIIEINHVS